MKRSYIVASCGACDKRGKAGKAEEGGKKKVVATPAVVRKTERLPCKEQRCCRCLCESTENGQATEATPTSAPREWHVIVYTEFVRYGATCNEEERKRKKETQRDRSVRVSRYEGRMEFVCVLMNMRIIAIPSPRLLAVPSMPTMTFARNCRTVARGWELRRFSPSSSFTAALDVWIYEGNSPATQFIVRLFRVNHFFWETRLLCEEMNESYHAIVREIRVPAKLS